MLSLMSFILLFIGIVFSLNQCLMMSFLGTTFFIFWFFWLMFIFALHLLFEQKNRYFKLIEQEVNSVDSLYEKFVSDSAEDFFALFYEKINTAEINEEVEDFIYLRVCFFEALSRRKYKQMLGIIGKIELKYFSKEFPFIFSLKILIKQYGLFRPTEKFKSLNFHHYGTMWNCLGNMERNIGEQRENFKKFLSSYYKENQEKKEIDDGQEEIIDLTK